jgi:CheY-like chemotaxis protein
MTNQYVLLVDDDEMNRFMMTEMLDMLGYAVLQAPDGQTAVEEAIAQADRIGVILMDIHMPGVSGVDATAEIRGLSEHPPAQTPILAVTADHTWVQAGEERQAGFSGSIAKPVDLGALKATLTEIMA